MTFQYKLKEYKNEDGEYTTYLPCDKATVENIIHSYWTDENLPNGLELIVITNSVGESIILEHSGKEVFEVYFVPIGERFLFHKKSRRALIYDTLSAFLKNDIHWLETNLNKTKNENKQIRKVILSNTFVYRVSKRHTWNALLPTLLFGIPMGLVMIGCSITYLSTIARGTPLDMVVPFFLLIGVFLFLPGLFIHFQYLKDNADLEITISKGNNVIGVKINGTKKNFLKTDIIKILRVENSAHRIPWSNYGYTQVKFKSGEVLNLTNLIIDQMDIFGKFDEHTDLLTKTRIIPSLRKRTSVK